MFIKSVDNSNFLKIQKEQTFILIGRANIETDILICVNHM